MKTQKYLVTIEMPDGDMISPGWIREIIQDDCDFEDKGRQKVSVEEIKAEESPDKTLDEAAHEYACTKSPYGANAFKAGAKWMAGQGVTLKVTDDTTWGEVNDFIHRNCDGVKEIQIRKKEENK